MRVILIFFKNRSISLIYLKDYSSNSNKVGKFLNNVHYICLDYLGCNWEKINLSFIILILIN